MFPDYTLAAIVAELETMGLRLANCTESGWYVNTKHGKVWATDLPARTAR